MTTPKKLVHWALNASLSELGSPFSEASSSDSCTSTSSLQYINSQLISHGFLHDTGLSLDGLTKGDADRVVKCVLGMLSQRIDDMSRTEDLSTKLRTLSYDHERLTSMYKSEAEKAANAEREMNLHKSRLIAANKSLQSSETAHKHTTAELQRTRTTLHALRATHQTEIKKLEKEKERMVERWSKLSDSQLRIGTLRAGLTCTNLDVVEASDVQLRGKGQGFLDVSLEQAEYARKELFEQNRKLRDLLLSAASGLQSLLHAARTAGETNAWEEPTPLASSTLFPNSPAEAVGDTFNLLFKSLRETISQKAETNPTLCSKKESPSSPIQSTKAHPSADTERLQAVVDKLRADLDEAQKQAAAAAAQTQELFDRYVEDQRLASSDAAEMSVDLMTVPARDEERQRLDARFKKLEEERGNFTEAAVRLGREKAALEAERLKFLEEKRSWEVQMMLAELPPTPAPVAGPSSSNPAVSSMVSSIKPPRSSPRKSPRKLKSKAASPRKTRVSRRSSGLSAVVPSPKAKSRVVPAYETEVIPSNVAPIPSSPSKLPEFKTSLAVPAPPSPALLTSTFVLPPPSPAASLPSRGAGGASLPPIPPLPKLEIPPPSEDSSEDDSMDITPEPASSASSSTSSSSTNASSQLSVPVPSTPSGRPFPMAKPFAQRMIHAYSPVKPSPLSRILMLADSPESPEGPRLDALAEVDESAMDISHIPASAPEPVRSLAEELGVSEDDNSPFREKQPPAPKVEPPPRKAAPEPARGGAKEKGKTRADAPAAPQQTSRARAGATLEKENVKRAKLSNPSGGSSGGSKSAGSSSSRDTKNHAAGKPASGAGARTRSGAGRGAAPAKPALKGGARRVPMGSAEAASVPTWRG